MEENGVDYDNTIERASDFLVVDSTNAQELETGDQVFQHLGCMETRDSSFGQNASPAILPAPVPITEETLLSVNAQMQLPHLPPFSAEDFQLVDQSGHSLCEVQSLEGSGTHVMIVASQSENGQVLHLVPSTQPGMAQVIIPQGQFLHVTSSQDVSGEKNCDGSLRTVAVAAIADNTSNYIRHPQASLTVSQKAATRGLEEPFPISPEPLPPNTPTWARRLRNCEKIGDSYRGYCSSETELESVLTLHKQQTQSVWGTRQSPSPAKPATRLMWKSQIYIKKVQKFPEHRVPTDPKLDKKIIRMEQEKAFNLLKQNLIEGGGVLRWYMQLPTQQAHQYHELETSCLSPLHFSVPSPEENEEADMDENCLLPSRLHPQVADKIKELVSQGTEQVYAVRKQLRKFVERELFKPDEVPEKHNLSFFPTVNDIKNHIHEVQKTLRSGKSVYNADTIPATLQWTTDSGNILTERVTVTLASPPVEGSSPEKAIIKVESNQTKEFLLPETAQLLSSLQPRVFAELKLQPAFTSTDGQTTVIAVDSHSPPSPSALPHSTDHSLLGQRQSLQATSIQIQNSTTSPVLGEQAVTNERVVTMGQLSFVGRTEPQRMLMAQEVNLLSEDVKHAALTNPEDAVLTGQADQETKEQAKFSEREECRDFRASSIT